MKTVENVESWQKCSKLCLRRDAYDGHGLTKDIQQLLIPAG